MSASTTAATTFDNSSQKIRVNAQHITPTASRNAPIILSKTNVDVSASAKLIPAAGKNIYKRDNEMEGGQVK